MIKSYPLQQIRRPVPARAYSFNWRRLGACGALVLALLVGVGLGANTAMAQEQTGVPVSVNINSDDASALASGLNGVGQSRAEAIIRYREAFGPFESIDELTEVKGIGPSTVERNRTVITLD